MKKKGTRTERELLHLFYETNKWMPCRIAGSGSTSIPSTDLLVGNKNRLLAIECKSSKSNTRYITRDSITQLIEFCKKFGAEPWIGMRFNNLEWYFLQPQELNKTKDGNFSISTELVKKKGLSFKNLIKK